MGDAPEIDGQVYIAGAKNVHPGDYATVLVENSDEYDLYGKLA